MDAQTAAARADAAPATPVLLREDAGEIAVLTLNRPQARNSLSEALLAALSNALAAIADERSVRAVVLGANIYTQVFAVYPALAEDLERAHRYVAATLAVRAAAGQDEEMTAFGAEEWAYLTGQALKWLRADLARRASQAKGPKRRQEVREALAVWKKDPGLAPVRDPAWLAAMPPDDRQAWEVLWRDVDAVLASVSQPAGSSAGP